MKVILIAATTICGRISPPGHGSLLDRRRLEKTRDETGASIMGANTLRTENPEMRGINGNLNPDRIRAIVSARGLIPVVDKKMFEHGPAPVVFTGAERYPALQDSMKSRARVVPLPQGTWGLSLQAAVDFLAGMGVESVLLEGGARLNYTALAEGIVDEVLLTLLPAVSGKLGSAALADGPEYLGEPFMRLELLASEPAATGELFLHYRIRRTG